MRFAIVSRLRKAEAVSREKAVTPKETNIDVEEPGWLRYLAGGGLSVIKKTENGRYYV